MPPDLPDDVTYEPTTGTYRAAFDWAVRPPSTGIARVVAAAADPDRIAPLAKSVDPDSLDDLLGRRGSVVQGQDQNLRLQFVHDGFEVFADRSGVVEVRPCAPADALQPK